MHPVTRHTVSTLSVDKWKRAFLASAILIVSLGAPLSAGEGPDRAVATPTISDDGRFVAFETSATNFSAHFLSEEANAAGPFWNVYWMDRETRRIYNAQHAGLDDYVGGSSNPSVSRDGEWIVFQSANDAIPGNEGHVNIYVSAVRSRAGDGIPASRFKLISRSPTGEAGNGISKLPSISGDGRFVVYKSNATNLTVDVVNGGDDYHIFRHDRDFDENGVFDEDGPDATRTILIGGSDTIADDDDHKWPTISSDGTKILFFQEFGDANWHPRWWNNGALHVTSAEPGGLTPDGTITLTTTHLYDPLHPEVPGTFYRYKNNIPQTFGFPDHAGGNVASAGASFVLTSTYAAIDPDDTNGNRDVYLLDRTKRTATLISAGVDGVANHNSGVGPPWYARDSYITTDGRYVAFSTNATNMGFVDNNGSLHDIIILDRETGERDRVEIISNEDDPDPDPDPEAKPAKTAAQKAALQKKIKKLKKSIKRAKKKGKTAQLKRLKKQLKAAQKKLRKLR